MVTDMQYYYSFYTPKGLERIAGQRGRVWPDFGQSRILRQQILAALNRLAYSTVVQQTYQIHIADTFDNPTLLGTINYNEVAGLEWKACNIPSNEYQLPLISQSKSNPRSFPVIWSITYLKNLPYALHNLNRSII